MSEKKKNTFFLVFFSQVGTAAPEKPPDGRKTDERERARLCLAAVRLPRSSDAVSVPHSRMSVTVSVPRRGGGGDDGGRLLLLSRRLRFMEIRTEHDERERDRTISSCGKRALEWPHVVLERVLQRGRARDDEGEEGGVQRGRHELPHAADDGRQTTEEHRAWGHDAVDGERVIFVVVVILVV